MKRSCLAVFGLVASLSHACYNDSDTYLTELRDNLDVTNAIIGRFTLYTPAYYKKRIEIQSQILKKDPNNLDAYDNISVAYDRIGDGQNALKWIREKRKHMANASDLHHYSTEANEGTFLIVRWIRGHKSGDVTDAIESEKLIAKALEINPNAHFGREFAQLYCIRAMIQSGKDTGEWEKYFTRNLVVLADKDHIDRKKLRYGIGGMMVLGAAWNMPVLIQAMAELVPEEGQFASLCREKLRYLSPSEGTHKDLVEKYPIISKGNAKGLDSSMIDQLLDNGAEYQSSQKDWINEQVAKGIHPDSGGDLWAGYQEVPPIPKEKLATATPLSQAGTFVLNWALMTLGCCFLPPILTLYFGVKIFKARQAR